MSPSRPDSAPLRGVLVDANLLVLLVVGALDPAIIPRHKRLQTFGPEDFELLCDLAANYQQVLVTPNTLTEASNLLAQHREPERSLLLTTLRTLIHESHEVVVTSADADDHPSFPRLGLTDAGLRGLVAKDTPLGTVDLDLYLAAAATDPLSAVNYRHIQQQFTQPT